MDAQAMRAFLAHYAKNLGFPDLPSFAHDNILPRFRKATNS